MSIYARAAVAALASRQAPATPMTAADINQMASDAISSAVNNAGISSLDAILSKSLPDFLTNNPMPDGKPWGTKNSTNTDQYRETPDTGVTRYYDWTVAKGRCAPDGVEMDCVLANNQYPGPTVEANWGDYIEVKIHNKIPDEGTSIHWHGILQKHGSGQWMDGVPGTTQCPIAPESTFTYRFRADLYGTSWWHAHYSAQYGSGLLGPMIIYGPKNVPDDIDLGPIMLSDWFHQYYTEEISELFNEVPNAVVPRADSNLINGMGSYPCSETSENCKDDMPMASFNFTSGKVHRLRLINPSSAATQKFTIDGHKFKVIATDFVEIEPYETDVITLGTGQRSDVLVYGSGEPTDAVYMRAFRPTSCSLSKGNEEVLASVYYEGADRSKQPSSSPGPNAYNGYCGNDPLEDTVPVYALEASEPDVTEIVPVELKSNGTHMVWYMGGRTFQVDYSNPMLPDVTQGTTEFDFSKNVHNYGSNKTIRFVIENTGPQPHPMHLHGHNIQIVAEGSCGDLGTIFREAAGGPGGPSGPPSGPEQSSAPGGTQGDAPADTPTDIPTDLPTDLPTDPTGLLSSVMPRQAEAFDLLNENSAILGGGAAGETMQHFGTCWDGKVTNPSNPARRDVAQLQSGSYIVIQWNQDNPGLWPLHCHIAWHLSAGFVWNILEHPEELQNGGLEIPEQTMSQCDNWSAWNKDHQFNRIDSI